LKEKAKPEVIVALDVELRESAMGLVAELRDDIGFFKLGSRLFTAEGPSIVKEIGRAGADIFLDLKFHDIPATVAGSVRAAAALGVRMMTLHTTGGVDMMRAAVRAAREVSQEEDKPHPLLVGVTVLTSLSDGDLASIAPGAGGVADMVMRLAQSAKRSGLDGVVSSVEEAAKIKNEFGDDFIVVTPGIRPAGYAKGDQKRVATPAFAKESGADFIVVGRPVIEAESPAKAAAGILKELREA